MRVRAKTFSYGGILVESFRSLTRTQPIKHLSLPSLAVVPLSQYEGAQAQWVVTVGDLVREEQPLALGVRPRDLTVHSPIPGVVEEFRELPLAGGGTTSAAVIRLEGSFHRTGRDLPKQDWATLSRDALLKRINDCGVLFLSGTLNRIRSPLDYPYPLNDLVINALQSEPYLTLPVHLLEERSEMIAEGILILQKIFQPKKTHLASDPEQPEAWVKKFGDLLSNTSLHVLQSRYPQAQEALLYQTLLGNGQLPNEGVEKLGCLILDLSSVLAVWEAVVENKPEIEKNVVFSGLAAAKPGVYRVRIGTTLAQFFKNTGGLVSEPAKILLGGPFRGHQVQELSSPITKSTQAVLALTKEEVNESEPLPCIRCGGCVTSCPVGLEPINLYKSILQGKLGEAREEGLENCVECGICSFVCPSRIPLLKEFQTAKGILHAG